MALCGSSRGVRPPADARPPIWRDAHLVPGGSTIPACRCAIRRTAYSSPDGRPWARSPRPGPSSPTAPVGELPSSQDRWARSTSGPDSARGRARNCSARAWHAGMLPAARLSVEHGQALRPRHHRRAAAAATTVRPRPGRSVPYCEHLCHRLAADSDLPVSGLLEGRRRPAAMPWAQPRRAMPLWNPLWNPKTCSPRSARAPSANRCPDSEMLLCPVKWFSTGRGWRSGFGRVRG